MRKVIVYLLVLLSAQLVACSGAHLSSNSGQQSAVTQAQAVPATGATNAPITRVLSFTLGNGTYTSVFQLITSFWPYPLTSLTINGNSYTANYMLFISTENGQGASIPLIQQGTFTLNAQGLTLTQQALYLLPGSGQSQDLVAPYFSSPGLTFTDNSPTNVAGLTYQFQDYLGKEDTQTFTANGLTFQPGLIWSNEATLSYYTPTAMVAPLAARSGSISDEFSLILQTPLPQFQPTATIPSNGTFAAPYSANDPALGAPPVGSPFLFTYLNSIVFSGNTYTTSSTLTVSLNGPGGTIGTLVGKGTYSTDSNGYMTLTQQSLVLTPASGQSGNIVCKGLIFTDGSPMNVSGATCTSQAGPLANGQVFQANGTSFGSNLTVISSTTLSLCSQTFVNCQFDTLESYVLQ